MNPLIPSERQCHISYAISTPTPHPRTSSGFSRMHMPMSSAASTVMLFILRKEQDQERGSAVGDGKGACQRQRCGGRGSEEGSR